MDSTEKSEIFIEWPFIQPEQKLRISIKYRMLLTDSNIYIAHENVENVVFNFFFSFKLWIKNKKYTKIIFKYKSEIN